MTSTTDGRDRPCESCELRHAAEVAVECIEYVKQYVEGSFLSAEEDCIEALALLRKALANQHERRVSDA